MVYEVPITQCESATDPLTITAKLNNITVYPEAPTLSPKDIIMLRDWQKSSQVERQLLQFYMA